MSNLLTLYFHLLHSLKRSRYRLFFGHGNSTGRACHASQGSRFPSHELRSSTRLCSQHDIVTIRIVILAAGVRAADASPDSADVRYYRSRAIVLGFDLCQESVWSTKDGLDLCVCVQGKATGWTRATVQGRW
jgi:hypothetical protein